MHIDNRSYKLSCGDLLLWKSNVVYDIDTTDGIVILGVNFDYLQYQRNKNYPIPPDLCPYFRESDLLENVHIKDATCLNETIYLNNMHHIEEPLRQMLHEYDTKIVHYLEQLASLFLNILVDVVREATTIRKYNVSTSNKIKKIITYIQNHYNENISNASIAKLFNYHPNYINKLMCLYTKKSLHQYILSYRISKAIDLMYDTTEPVSQIAFKVGFTDPCHFSKLFKQKIGMSPSKYRKSHLRE